MKVGGTPQAPFRRPTGTAALSVCRAKIRPMSHRLLPTSNDQRRGRPSHTVSDAPRTPPPPPDGLTAPESGGVAGTPGFAGVGALDERRRARRRAVDPAAREDRRRGRDVLPGVAVLAGRPA